jgi:hypothetical protein
MNLLPGKVRPVGNVIEEKIKFSIALGISDKNEWVKDSIVGLLSGTAVGLGVAGVLSIAAASSAAAATAAFFAGLGFFGNIGLVLGITSIPAMPFVVPIAIPVLSGLGVAIGTTAVVRGSKKFKKFSCYRGYKSFNTPLNRLGYTVGEMVFGPVIGFALLDGTLENNEMEYIKTKMNEWGYSQEHVDSFVQYYATKNVDEIKGFVANFDGWLKKMLEKNKNIEHDINIGELKNKTIKYCEELYNGQGRRERHKDDYLNLLKSM